MKTLISKDVMQRAIRLSAEWGNTCFVILNESGVPAASVWQHFKWLEPKPEVIAHVNGNDGFILKNNNYVFEVEPKELL